MPQHQMDNWLEKELSGGRYRITSKLGQGGMGAVYRAWDRNLKIDVVIKIPLQEIPDDEEFAVRFAREVSSLVQLAHPHIVKISDVGEHQGHPFAVMQFLSGGSLEDRRPCNSPGHYQPQNPLTLKGWLCPIADALDFVHRQSAVHRDVKPANILFDAHSHAYLSDFGIARFIASSRESTSRRPKTITGAGIVIGTPEYMAPEIIRGKPFDGRADQYSLAVMVFELLAGRRPFEAQEVTELFVKHSIEEPPLLNSVNPRISEGLSAIVGKGLAKDPDRRFSTCREFADAVLAALGRRAATGSTLHDKTTGSTRRKAVVAAKREKVPTKLGHPPGNPQRTPRIFGAAGLGCAGGFLLVLFAALFLAANRAGTLRLIIGNAAGGALDVRIDGDPVPVASIDDSISLAPGSHDLLIISPGHKALRRSFEVNSGEATVVKIDLEPKSASQLTSDESTEGQPLAEPDRPTVAVQGADGRHAPPDAGSSSSITAQRPPIVLVIDETESGREGVSITFTGRVSELGTESQLLGIEVDYGDGSDLERYELGDAHSFEFPHVYESPGEYELAVSVNSVTRRETTSSRVISIGSLTAPPSMAVREEMRTTLRSRYSGEYAAATTLESHAEWARQLVNLSRQSRPGSVDRYVLLEEAIDQAASACSAETALQAIKDMESYFAVSGFLLKAAVMERIAESAETTIDKVSLARTAAELAEEAAESGDSLAARSLLYSADRASFNSEEKASPERSEQWIAKIDEAERHRQEVENARAALRKNPLDPPANGVVGRHLCYVKGNWAAGLSFLARAADGDDCLAAAAELRLAKSISEQVRIADRWMEIAAGRPSDWNVAQREHALHLYQSLLPKVTGSVRSRIQTIVDEHESSPDDSRSAAIRVTDPDGPSAMLPVVAGYGDNVVMAWQQTNPSSGKPEIVARLLDAAGNIRIREIPVDGVTREIPERPSVSVGQDGSFVVVWEQNDRDGGTGGIFGRRFRANGRALGKPFRVNTFLKGSKSQPAIAHGGNGRFVVAWTSGLQISQDDVFARIFTLNAGVSGNEIPCHVSTALDQNMPAVAMTTQGSFMVAWVQSLYSGASNICCRAFDLTGRPIGNEVVANIRTDDNPGGTMSTPAICTDGGGRFLLAWTDFDDMKPRDGDGSGVFARFFDVQGRPTGDDFQVNRTIAGSQADPSVCLLQNRSAIVVFASGKGRSSVIVGRQFDSTGMPLGKEIPLSNAEDGEVQGPKIAAVQGDETVIVVWSVVSADGKQSLRSRLVPVSEFTSE